jgi:hypothetical protein
VTAFEPPVDHEVYEVGPNPHAEQMLVIYLPREGLLFEGGMLDLDVAVGQPTVSGGDTRALLHWIDRQRLNVKIIVPVHGRVGNIGDLRAAVARSASDWK